MQRNSGEVVVSGDVGRCVPPYLCDSSAFLLADRRPRPTTGIG